MDRDTDTQGESLRENPGRDWSGASAGQGMPWIAGHHQKQGERHGADAPSESP